ASTFATDVGIPVSLAASVTDGAPPLAYNWTLGNGQSAIGPTTTVSYASPSSYTVTLTVKDAAGHAVYATQIIRVAAAPAVNATVSAASVTADHSVTFSANGSGGTGGLTYAWNFGDGSGATGASPSHVYALAGTYTAVVWANDTTGGSARSSVPVRVTAASPNQGTPKTNTPNSSGSSGGYGAQWIAAAAIVGLIVGALLGLALGRRRPPPPLRPAATPVPAAAAWSEATSVPVGATGSSSSPPPPTKN
ncbi:MAG: PKD domain-containing protein, partial [Thermoplasmata archaeon]